MDLVYESTDGENKQRHESSLFAEKQIRATRCGGRRGALSGGDGEVEKDLRKPYQGPSFFAQPPLSAVACQRSENTLTSNTMMNASRAARTCQNCRVYEYGSAESGGSL